MKVKTANYGLKSISVLGSMIWNSLPNEIKSSRNANQFETLIEEWFSRKKGPATFQINKFRNTIPIIASS